MNGDVQENRMLCLKEAQKVKKENKGNLQWIMKRKDTFVINELDVWRMWKEHTENLRNIESNEEEIVNVCVYSIVQEKITILGMS